MANLDALVPSVAGAGALMWTAYCTLRRTRIVARGRNTKARELLARWRDWAEGGADPQPAPPPSLVSATAAELDRPEEEVT